jgi:DNA-binding MarR family transcriptional regulator
MDAVMFQLKGAHLAVQRVGRGLLRRHGLTPARFDLMNALGRDGMKQSDLWRRLDVVRSVVCEMVAALERLGWVERVRAERDRRTWIVRLTARGRAVFEGAYGRWVETGDVTLFMDEAISDGLVEADALHQREVLFPTLRYVMRVLAVRRPFRGPALYPWDPEDYYFWFADTELTPGPEDLPFVA